MGKNGPTSAEVHTCLSRHTVRSTVKNKAAADKCDSGEIEQQYYRSNTQSGPLGVESALVSSFFYVIKDLGSVKFGLYYSRACIVPVLFGEKGNKCFK